MASFKNTVRFFLEDFPRTLFPLDVNKILIENFSEELGKFVYEQISSKENSAVQFLPQIRVHASKPKLHLRRTVKLDPVAEFFLYDLVYRNRSAFRITRSATRLTFGYAFNKGNVTSPTGSYRAFKTEIYKASQRYEFSLKFDISAYFNSIYHHDLVNWFRNIASHEEDVLFFSKYLRQINSGRSTDCLPQGIIPAKIIGSHFLKFVDNSNRLLCSRLLRFMDDFYLYSRHRNSLVSDFFLVQKLLGERGLSVNPAKTKLGRVEHQDIEGKIDEIKLKLLKRRRHVIMASGEDDEDEDLEDGEDTLDEEEEEYLFALLKSSEIEEEDAELVLAVMRDHGEDVLQYIPDFLTKFPNLSKNIYHFSSSVQNKEGLATHIIDHLKGKAPITEYQLFWLAKIAETELKATSRYGDILLLLYEHPRASKISKAKVLEINEKGFGLDDLREENLRTGSSDWLSWASAVGVRVEKKANRNHLLSYFSNGSPMNKLISDCVRKL